MDYKSVTSSGILGQQNITGAVTQAYINPPPPPTQSPSAIRDTLGGSEQLLSELASTIALLDQRLDTVVMPSPPTPSQADTGRTTPTQMTSHVRGRLHILNGGLQDCIAHLQSLMARIEV